MSMASLYGNKSLMVSLTAVLRLTGDLIVWYSKSCISGSNFNHWKMLSDSESFNIFSRSLLLFHLKVSSEIGAFSYT